MKVDDDAYDEIDDEIDDEVDDEVGFCGKFTHRALNVS
jgi:hypothetical protein